MQVYERALDDLDNQIVRVNNADVPAPYARNLEQEMLPNARKIVEAVRAVTPQRSERPGGTGALLDPTGRLPSSGA